MVSDRAVAAPCRCVPPAGRDGLKARAEHEKPLLCGASRYSSFTQLMGSLRVSSGTHVTLSN